MAAAAGAISPDKALSAPCDLTARACSDKPVHSQQGALVIAHSHCRSGLLCWQRAAVLAMYRVQRLSEAKAGDIVALLAFAKRWAKYMARAASCCLHNRLSRQ